MLTRSNENTMYRETPVSRLSTMRETGVSRYIFKGDHFMHVSEKFKQWILILVGSLSVGLAFAGIFLPLLPTTPFLLLAAACYLRSSDRFYHWLIYHRWFGNYIRNYREGRGIPLITKITAITLLWLTIGYSALFVVSAWLVKLVLIGIALGVTIHLLKTKTLNPQETPVSPPIREPAED